MAEVTITGVDTVMAGLARLIAEAPQALGAALTQEAETIMTDSRENYVPVDLGTLKGSGLVGEPEFEAASVSVTMGYGGAASAYALAVHEYPSAYSPHSWQAADAKGHGVHFTVGGPKYLERPFLEAAGEHDERLAAHLRPWLERGGA